MISNMTTYEIESRRLGTQMTRVLRVFLVLIFVTLVIDILLRLVNPTPQILATSPPLIGSWIDIVLAVEFGIPVGMDFYSRFL